MNIQGYYESDEVWVPDPIDYGYAISSFENLYEPKNINCDSDMMSSINTDLESATNEGKPLRNIASSGFNLTK